MNVLTPKWLSRERHEPVAPPVPRIRSEENRQMAMDFMNAHDRTLEEVAWLRAENEQLRVDVKAEREKSRMLETELNFVRNDRDGLLKHDSMMVGGLDDLEVLIVNLKERSRAHAYAPPGSGTQDEQSASPQDEQRVEALAKALAPERDHEQQ